jgi:hypothetical protein
MRKIKMGILACVVGGGLAFGGMSATASTVFYDNFEGYGGGTQENWSPPAGSPWIVTDGTIDLIHSSNPWGLSASTGTGLFDGGNYFLDLDGGTLNAGTLFSINLDNLSSVTAGGPGPFMDLIAGRSYRVAFIMAGNQRGGTDTVNLGVAFGTDLSTATQLDTISLSSTSPWTEYSFDFIHQAGASIYFDNLGGDNVGALLDNVYISIIPVPPAAGLILLGMVGIGLRRRFILG